MVAISPPRPYGEGPGGGALRGDGTTPSKEADAAGAPPLTPPRKSEEGKMRRGRLLPSPFLRGGAGGAALRRNATTPSKPAEAAGAPPLPPPRKSGEGKARRGRENLASPQFPSNCGLRLAAKASKARRKSPVAMQIACACASD